MKTFAIVAVIVAMIVSGCSVFVMREQIVCSVVNKTDGDLQLEVVRESGNRRGFILGVGSRLIRSYPNDPTVVIEVWREGNLLYEIHVDEQTNSVSRQFELCIDSVVEAAGP